MWMYRRSKEPSKTNGTGCTVKSKLSKVDTNRKFLTLKDFGGQEDLSSDEDSGTFLQEVIEMGNKNHSESQLLKYFKTDATTSSLGIHRLMLKFLSTGQSSHSEFIRFCANIMTEELCSEATVTSTSQSGSCLRFELKYGRITGSNVYDAAHSKTCDEIFIQKILGLSKCKGTMREKQLKESVVKCLQRTFKVKLKRIGVQLNPKYPIFGASPDAICDEYLVEIKCPETVECAANYLTQYNTITAKYNAQVQLQMFMSNTSKCLFCVTDPDFENNSKFHYNWVEFDGDYLDRLLTAAEHFWCQNIFPELLKINL